MASREHRDERPFSHLAEVFKCFICMEKVTDAHLCPHCSKLCCYSCARRWLTERRSQCPHCRASLHLHELVNCRWVEEVTRQIDAMRPPGQDDDDGDERCVGHGEPLSVYCWTCGRCVCHRCALWGGLHSGHAFGPLEDVYERDANRIKEELSRLRRCFLRAVAKARDADREAEEARRAKAERAREARAALAKLDAALQTELSAALAERDALAREAETMERLLRDGERKLRTLSKPRLIDRCAEIVERSRRARSDAERPPRRLGPAAGPRPPADDAPPEYESAAFAIVGFSGLRRDGEPAYSPPLLASGTGWRLKVYPNGNGVARGEYLSAFLELTDGPPGASKYDYRIEMVHRRGGPDVAREFTSDFEPGECWGYNRFFRLDALAAEGYLDERSDSLVLKFQVRPPTYRQKCRDQQWYINRMSARQSRHVTRADAAIETDREIYEKLASLIQTNSEEPIEDQPNAETSTFPRIDNPTFPPVVDNPINFSRLSVPQNTILSHSNTVPHVETENQLDPSDLATGVAQFVQSSDTSKVSEPKSITQPINLNAIFRQRHLNIDSVPSNSKQSKEPERSASLLESDTLKLINSFSSPELSNTPDVFEMQLGGAANAIRPTSNRHRRSVLSNLIASCEPFELPNRRTREHSPGSVILPVEVGRQPSFVILSSNADESINISAEQNDSIDNDGTSDMNFVTLSDFDEASEVSGVLDSSLLNGNGWICPMQLQSKSREPHSTQGSSTSSEQLQNDNVRNEESNQNTNAAAHKPFVRLSDENPTIEQMLESLQIDYNLDDSVPQNDSLWSLVTFDRPVKDNASPEAD